MATQAKKQTLHMQNTLIDNSKQFYLVDYLNQLIGDAQCKEICIATGYWDLKGTKLVTDTLRPFFERGGKLRMLIGQEPTIRDYQLQTTTTSEEKFPDFYIQRDVYQLTEEYVPVAQMLLQYTNLEDPDQSQIQIRVYGQKGDEKKFLHAKCYIFLGEGQAFGIIGSSNFTEKGLQDNAELNHLETTPTAVTGELSQYNPYKTHLTWFNQMWEDESCENWTGQFIKEILEKAPIAKKAKEIEKQNEILTPYETYIRVLQDRFGALADTDVKAVLKGYLPSEYEAYNYQLDAAALCYDIMHLHGGFMLGDVVGLGKTVVGVLLIKYYLEFAESEGRDRKVLIIVPPAIKSAWEDTIAAFDNKRDDKIQPCIQFITTGSIDKLTDDDSEDVEAESFEEDLQQEHYGLIVIDESHNFRNNETQMYRSLDNLINTIGRETGYYPYIGLLSATPQNNTPEDIQNQIYLFQRTPRECSFPGIMGRNLEAFFSDKKIRYQKIISWHPRSETERQTNRAALMALSKEIHDKVLTEILVRRTRSDVRDGYHASLHFPEVIGPCNLTYTMNPRLVKLFADTMECIAPTEEQKAQIGADYISFMRYRAIEYFAKEEIRNRYKGRGGMTPEKTSNHLATIMRILLVKRLESSFSAFRRSLENLQRYTQNMITMWDNDCIFVCPQIDVNKELNLEEKRKKDATYTLDRCFDDIRAKIERLNKQGRNDKQQNAEYHTSDFRDEYYQYLLEDKALIDNLVERWKQERQDPKLYKFIASIDTLFNKQHNKPQKLVIFSEAIDTVKELADVVNSAGFNALCITAANRKDKEQTIRENFDANYKGEWKDDYQVIITTEVLAEGVNLHRANTILNYDTPWNSTRLIQRIGRVNRIGSVENQVFVYNFYPSAEGDKEINLIQRAYTKLQSFHALFGEDNKVFSMEEELSKTDYKRLVDGEQTPFTRYIVELQQYKQAHPERFEYIRNVEAPMITGVRADEQAVYCVLKTDANTNGSMYVRIGAEGEGKMISSLELLEALACEPSTPSVEPLPVADYEQRAIETFQSHIHALQRTNAAGARMFDQAMSVIREWLNDERLTQESKQRFKLAAKYISKRDKSITQSVLAIARKIGDPQQSLFAITPEEINDIITAKLHAISEKSLAQHGKPYIFVASSQVK